MRALNPLTPMPHAHSPDHPPSDTARRIAIISCGHTLEALRPNYGDFDDWIAQGLQSPLDILRVDATAEPELPDWSQLAGVVVTGSHAMVTDRAPWSEHVAAWLRLGVQAEVPILGICYGHQLLAHATGGTVDYHPHGIELGSHGIDLHAAAQQDALFAHMPAHFTAQLVHSQSARALPEGAVVLASNGHEAHQAFRVGRSAWGVQFHPEFSATAMQAYVAKLAPAASAAAAIGVQDTPEAASLLQRFGQIAAAQAHTATAAAAA